MMKYIVGWQNFYVNVIQPFHAYSNIVFSTEKIISNPSPSTIMRRKYLIVEFTICWFLIRSNRWNLELGR